MTAAIASQAQEPSQYSISGFVLNQSNNKPLQSVTVALFEGNSSKIAAITLSDSTGYFLLANINPGNYTLRFTDVLHVQKDLPVRISAGDLVTDTMRLTEKVNTMEEVIVTSRKPLIERKIDRVIMNVESSPVSSGGSVMDVLQTAPGVTVMDQNISLKGKKGVNILLNGRPTNLSAQDIARILQSMPANSVSRIEVISNPSARYDAAGSAGVINIITKKIRRRGFNATTDLVAGYGVYPKYNGGLNLNYKLDAVNLFGNYYIDQTKGFGKYTSKKIIDNDLLFDENGDAIYTVTSHNFMTGMDWEVNDRNNIGLNFSGNIMDDQTKENFNTSFLYLNSLDSSLQVVNNTNTRYNNLAWNLNHEWRIDSTGKVLLTNVDYSRYDSRVLGLFNNTYYDSNKQPLREMEQLRNNSAVGIDIATVKVDYVHPIKKHNLNIEAGIKSSMVRTESDIRFERKKGTIWETDPDKSNRFIYDEYINAAYISANKKLGAWEIQMGLRAEQTNNKGNLVTTGEVNRNDYLQFFPTVYINRTLPNDQVIGFSYGRRINRPSYEDLNPFIYYNSPFSFYQGSPFLKPEYTNSFELSYSWQDELLFSVEYARTKDYFTYLSYLDNTTRVTRETINNFRHYTTYGASISYDKEITNWWYLSANVDVYHEAFNSFYLTEELRNEITNVSSNITSQFTLPDMSSIELRSNYRSPTVDGIKKNYARYRLDMGYKKSFLKNNLTLKLSLRDILYTYRRNGINRAENLYQEFTNRGDSRVFVIGLSYKFGNQKIKSRDTRQGNKDELNRIKGLD